MAKRPRPPPEKYIISRPEKVLFDKSKIRDYIKSKGCNTSGDILDGSKLNDAIVNMLDSAIQRAKANGRKTVQEKDL